MSCFRVNEDTSAPKKGLVSVLYLSVNRLLRKLFKTNVINTAKLCQDYFGFDLLDGTIEKQRKTGYDSCCDKIRFSFVVTVHYAI